MSVQMNTYAMYGVILPYAALGEDADAAYDRCEPYTDNAFKPDFNPKGGVTILMDGMCGKYVAVGHVFAKSDNGQGFDEPVSLGAVPDMAVIDAVSAALVDIGLDPKDVADGYGWHVISHYR